MPHLVRTISRESRPIRSREPEPRLRDVTGQRHEPSELLVEPVLDAGCVPRGTDRAVQPLGHVAARSHDAVSTRSRPELNSSERETATEEPRGAREQGNA